MNAHPSPVLVAEQVWSFRKFPLENRFVGVAGVGMDNGVNAGACRPVRLERVNGSAPPEHSLAAERASGLVDKPGSEGLEAGTGTGVGSRLHQRYARLRRRRANIIEPSTSSGGELVPGGGEGLLSPIRHSLVQHSTELSAVGEDCT